MHLFRVFTILSDHVVLQSSLPAWELPVSQGFKQQVTSMNCAMFRTSLLPHFVSPTLRAGLAVTGGSAPGSAAGWPWAVQVLQSSPLLQRMQCLQVGFGTDKEETSALRCCCCSALWIWDLAVLGDAQTDVPAHGTLSAKGILPRTQVGMQTDISTFSGSTSRDLPSHLWK